MYVTVKVFEGGLLRRALVCAWGGNELLARTAWAAVGFSKLFRSGLDSEASCAYSERNDVAFNATNLLAEFHDSVETGCASTAST